MCDAEYRFMEKVNWKKYDNCAKKKKIVVANKNCGYFDLGACFKN